jgi:uncharacterized DUF497 family protein
VSGFDWDPVKAEANRRKHGITFEHAKEMLDRNRSYERPDVDHSVDEDRNRTIGYTSEGQVIVVITSISGPVPRIISARRATKRERNEYVG